MKFRPGRTRKSCSGSGSWRTPCRRRSGAGGPARHGSVPDRHDEPGTEIHQCIARGRNLRGRPASACAFDSPPIEKYGCSEPPAVPALESRAVGRPERRNKRKRRVGRRVLAAGVVRGAAQVEPGRRRGTPRGLEPGRAVRRPGSRRRSGSPTPDRSRPSDSGR